MTPVLDLLLDSCDRVVPLLRSQVLAHTWEVPSALAGWTNGGLAGHLARSAFNLERALDRVPDGDAGTDVVGYYAATDRDEAASPVGRRIRELGDQEAARGPVVLADRFVASVAAIRMRAPGPGTRVELFGRPMTVADCAAACLLELVVHTDDLAVSLAVTPPGFRPEAVDVVVTALARIAVRRHGTAAVVRALARSERAPATISAF